MLQNTPAPAPAPQPQAKWAVAAISPLKPHAFFVGWKDVGDTTSTRWASFVGAARLFDTEDEARAEAQMVAPSYRSRRVSAWRIPAKAEG